MKRDVKANNCKMSDDNASAMEPSVSRCNLRNLKQKGHHNTKNSNNDNNKNLANGDGVTNKVINAK